MLNFFKKFSNIDCVVLGDTNINILEYGQDNEITRFLDIIFNFKFIPQTIIPTRITPTSSTLLDQIYIRNSIKTNNFKVNDCFTGCLTTDISDHLANFLCIPYGKKIDPKKDRPLIRCFSEINKSNFIQTFLNSEKLSHFNSSDDVNVLYENLIDVIDSTFDKCFPLIRLSRSKFRDKDWVSKEIKQSCNFKSKLYKKWINSKNSNDWNLYKSFAKTFNNIKKGKI